LSDASEPVFDAGGKYLWLAASTDAGPFLTWFSQASSDIEQTNSLYLITLAKETPSPFAKESDEEQTQDEEQEGDEEDGEEADDGAGEEAEEEGEDGEDEPVEVKIDLDGLAQRIVAVPLPPAFYSSLQTGEEGQLFYLEAERGEFSGEPAESALVRFDLEEREEQVLLEGVQDFELAAGREKVLVVTEEGGFVRPLGHRSSTRSGASTATTSTTRATTARTGRR
jgi:tricorn protease